MFKYISLASLLPPFYDSSEQVVPINNEGLEGSQYMEADLPTEADTSSLGQIPTMEVGLLFKKNWFTRYFNYLVNFSSSDGSNTYMVYTFKKLLQKYFFIYENLPKFL